VPVSGSPAPRVLLVGPQPPPFGGISVHVATLERQLVERGLDARVLDAGGHRASPSGRAAQVALLGRLRERARAGWTVHVHTNGHNRKSWLLILSAGLAAAAAPRRIVTLHSGLVPEWLAGGEAGARSLAKLALRPYDRVLCVSERLREAVAAIGVPEERLAVSPAFLPVAPRPVALPEEVSGWLAERSPVLSTTLFFRPEYGFDLLLEAMATLRKRHPAIGCLVLGDGDGAAAAAADPLVRELGSSLHLAGDVPHELCLALLARSDLFVRPARTDGDACSVREALHLGVPVVASDAAVRPAGTVLFRSGDAAALAARLAGVLASPQRPITAGRGLGDAAGVEALIDLYRDGEPAPATDEEGACAPSSWAS
jgi:glycosyltransferase involved in cell wall biosynthesis